MSEAQPNNNKPAPWYKHRWPWILMSGPFCVVVAGCYTLYLANKYSDDLVTDDYYKEGKYINMQIARDDEAAKRHISAQVLFNDDGSAAKVLVDGDFDRRAALHLMLLHPAKQSFDQTVVLRPAADAASGNKAAYTATLNKLPPAAHWYVRLEDSAGKWRVEGKWLLKQGRSVTLKPKFDETLSDKALAASAASIADQPHP